MSNREAAATRARLDWAERELAEWHNRVLRDSARYPRAAVQYRAALVRVNTLRASLGFGNVDPDPRI